MRGILLDWPIQVHARFRLLHETFFLCVNIIDLPIGTGRVARQAPAGRHYVPLCLQGRGNSGPFRMPLPSLRRILIHHVRDPACRALRTEDDRLELVIPKPNALPSSYQQGRRLRRQSSNHPQVFLGGRDTRMVSLATSPSLMTAPSIWLARLILDIYKWVGTCHHAHGVFFDSFREDCKPRALFLLRRERVSPYRELDVKRHCKTHTTRVVSQKVRRETVLEGKHARLHPISDLYRVQVSMWVCE
jgi:hypothetical protein